jgi:hypothetical protein
MYVCGGKAVFDPLQFVDLLNGHIGSTRVLDQGIGFKDHWFNAKAFITRKTGDLMVIIKTRYAHDSIDLSSIVVQVYSCDNHEFVDSENMRPSSKNFGEWYVYIPIGDEDKPARVMINFVCSVC